MAVVEETGALDVLYGTRNSFRARRVDCRLRESISKSDITLITIVGIILFESLDNAGVIGK